MYTKDLIVTTTNGTYSVDYPYNTMDTTNNFINKEDYKRDLKQRQKEHLDSIQRMRDSNWRPCLHDSCPDCLGTGIRRDGGICIHGISCPCPKCSPTYM